MTDQSSAYHYQVIARALRVIDAEGPTLTLEDLARRMNMSPAHFQRVFSQWVGVSPKRYQQYLTLTHARRLLAERRTLLGTALETGLSGTGRLHDLFLTWEAMSPGDYARGGAGLTLRWGWFDSPFGPALAMATDKGICGLGFADAPGDTAALEDLTRRWPMAAYVEDPDAIRPLAEAAFDGRATRLHLLGAPFQIKVWEALLAIPYGQTRSYAEQARAIARPSATRAVAAANGQNKVSIIVPCHRVIGSDGSLTGFGGGLPRKRALLAQAVARGGRPADPLAALAEYGGFEIAMMAGAMLGAAEAKMVLLIDGFIVTSALLVAHALAPEILDYCVFAHRSNEAGHVVQLARLGVEPLVQLDLRLGEGTGAALAYPLVQAAVNFMNEMASFESAGVAGKA